MAAASIGSSIYIYATREFSPAVWQTNVSELSRRLQECNISSARIIHLTDRSYLLRETLQSKGILIVPGGHSLMLAGDWAQITGLTSRIEAAVRRGWNYVGLCSGGNLACTRLMLQDEAGFSDYSEHFGLLKLLPLEARSPAYPLNQMNSNGSNNGRIVPMISSEGEFNVYWNEGSYFTPLKFSSGLILEGRYNDIPGKPFAVAGGMYGLGKVVVTGVHPEIQNDPGNPHFEHRLGRFGEDFEEKQSFLKKIFTFAEIL